MAFSSLWLRQASLYKFRYVLGYGFVIVLLLFIVGADIGNLPDGLSHAEMTQAVTSNSLTFGLDFRWMVNIAYDMLQKLSVDILGLSRLSLILPSLLFGTATVVVFALTMRHWFHDTVAVVTTVICMTATPFIGMLRSATPEIMLPFWTVLLIYGAVRLLVKREHAFHWKLLIVFASIGLLYTPYGIYPFVAIIGSALFHPHVRSRLRHIKSTRIVVLSALMLAGATPLVILLIKHPEMVSTLTGFDAIRTSLSHLPANLSNFYAIYFNAKTNGFVESIIVPQFNLATLALIILGVLKSVKDRYTARSYVLLSWFTVTVILAIAMPSVTTLIFMPASLLTAVGIDALVVEWYKLFPRNPYARIGGLIPLTVLFMGISLGNVSHYFNSYYHVPNQEYNQSLQAVKQALTTEGDHQVVLVAPEKDVAFYTILEKEYRYLKVTRTLPDTTATPVFVLPDADNSLKTIPSRIITSSTKENSVALRIYRPQ